MATGEVCTRRVRYDQIPIKVNYVHAVNLVVPFGMTTVAGLYVARPSLDAQAAKGYGGLLRGFAGN